MSVPAAPPASPDWFDVSFDEERGLIRLSFDQDSYVRFFSRADIIALVVELGTALLELRGARKQVT